MEKDCSYTLIAVSNDKRKRVEVKLKFAFFFNEGDVLLINMGPKVAFVYSAYFLSHRQEGTPVTHEFNVSAYGPKRFYDNVKFSLNRAMKMIK